MSEASHQSFFGFQSNLSLVAINSLSQVDVLAVSDKDDPHNEVVIGELKDLNKKAIRFNLSDILSVQVYAQRGSVTLIFGDRKLQITSSTTVWWHRMGGTSLTDFNADEAKFAQSECLSILLGAFFAVGVRWVDDPLVVYRAELKLLQLRLVESMGIAVPEYCVTNIPERAREFSLLNSIVAKALSSGPGLNPYTSEVFTDDVGMVSELPTFLQTKVIARSDIRVVVVGKKFHVWQRLRGEGTLDWRSEDKKGTGFSLIDDNEIGSFSVRITSSLGLSVAVLDWLETDNGPVFLEINPQGAWLFLKKSREIIAPIFARHLAGV